MTANSSNPEGSASAGASADDGLNFVTTWRTVRKYWTTAMATMLAVSLGTIFFTLGQKKIYQAQATIEFDPSPPRPLGSAVQGVVEMGTGSYWNNREYYETQYKVIQSRRVAAAVVQALDLTHDTGFLKNLPDGPPPKPSSVSPEDAAAVLQSRLTVEAVKESRLALVRYEDASPTRAQRVLAAVVDTYIDQNLENALTSTTSAVEWLRTQLDKLKEELESSEMALHNYKEQKNILSVAFDDQSNMLREEMKQLSDALTMTQVKREELKARYSELAAVPNDDPSSLPASELLQSGLLHTLRERYVEALRDRDSLIGSGKGREHPEVKAADARVGIMRQSLLAEVRNIQGAVGRDLATIGRQQTGLAQLLETAKRQALDLNLLEIEYDRLKRTKENNQRLYGLVLERTKESDLTRMMRVNNVRVIDRPLAPPNPIRPRVPVNIAVGLIAGIALGVGAAAMRALLDRTLKTPDDVERDLGLPFLGLIPMIDRGAMKQTYRARRSRRRGLPAVNNPELIVHEHPTSGIAESSRALRTNLMFIAPDRPYRTVLVTSSSPSEGKTTVTCCIAIAMAQAGQRVVLLDCDLRRPRLHRIFRRSSETGVTTALLERAPLDEEALKTDIPNLSVIPAGPIPPNPAELLHSERFKAFLKELQERYDRVIIDSPPVVAVTDAAVLSTLVDGTIVVVRAFRTAKEVVRHGIRSIQDVGGKIAGAVLNAVDLDRHEYNYYYYYYKRDNYQSATEGPKRLSHAEAPPSVP